MMQDLVHQNLIHSILHHTPYLIGLAISWIKIRAVEDVADLRQRLTDARCKAMSTI